MKVFYGIEEGFVLDNEAFTDDITEVFETPLKEEYITHIDFNDDFADEVQRVFPEVNKQNFFHLAIDSNSEVANYTDAVYFLTLDYNDPELTAFITDKFYSCVKDFNITSSKIQIDIGNYGVHLEFYVEGYSTNEPTQGGEAGYTFPIELTEDEIALLYKLVW